VGGGGERMPNSILRGGQSHGTEKFGTGLIGTGPEPREPPISKVDRTGGAVKTGSGERDWAHERCSAATW